MLFNIYLLQLQHNLLSLVAVVVVVVVVEVRKETERNSTQRHKKPSGDVIAE